MRPDLASLELGLSDLEEIRRALAGRIREGLSSGEGEIEGAGPFWFFNHRSTTIAIGVVAFFESAKVLRFF